MLEGECSPVEPVTSGLRYSFTSLLALHKWWDPRVCWLCPLPWGKYFQRSNWNTHISQITSKANRPLGFVKRNVRTKNQSVKELASKTLVRPQVEYASTVWSPYTKQNIQKIKMVQRMAARWVSNSYSYHDSVFTLSNLGWRSLEYRRYDSRLAMFYKIQYGLVAVSMPSYFECPTRISRHMHSLSFR